MVRCVSGNRLQPDTLDAACVGENSVCLVVLSGKLGLRGLVLGEGPAKIKIATPSRTLVITLLMRA